MSLCSCHNFFRKAAFLPSIRRPAVVVSSPIYHAARPDVVMCLITSRIIAIGPTDYALQDWAQAGLRVPSVFRSIFATLPSTTHPVRERCWMNWKIEVKPSAEGQYRKREWRLKSRFSRVAETKKDLIPLLVTGLSPFFLGRHDEG